MRVALINPPILPQWNLETTGTHLGLGYIASFLEQHKIDVDILDCIEQNYTIPDIINIINNTDYQVIGFSTYFYNYPYVIRMAKMIKKMKPELFIIFGGYQPSLNYMRMKSDFKFADCFIIGEGEITTYNVIKNLNGDKWKNVPGITYLSDDRIVFTGNADLIEELDKLPWPKRVKYDTEMNIISTRGCYSECSFCSSTDFKKVCKGKYMRRRSPDDFVKEMTYLVSRGAHKIFIYDSTFDISTPKGQEWVDKFIVLMKKQNLKTQFTCFLRVNDVISQKERIKQLMSVGLVYVYVGIESLLQKHLDFYKKNVTVEQNIAALHILDDIGIRYDIGFLLFNPITEMQDILDTIRIFREQNFNRNKWIWLKPISHSLLIAYYGSGIYDYLLKNNLTDNSPKGYKFENKDVELCFNVCTKWQEAVKKIYNYYYLFDVYNDKKNMISSIKNVYYEFYCLDIDFLEELSVAVINNPIGNISDFDSIIHKHYCKFEILIDQLEKIKSILI